MIQHSTASTIIILPKQVTSILKVTKPVTMTYTILSKTLVLDIFTQYGSMSNRKLQLRALITALKNLSIATKETVSPLFVNIYPLSQLQIWYKFFVFDDEGELLILMGNLKCK